MLISYRDSKRYPSDALALQTWVRLAELAARQVHAREFDPTQFARALDLCRRLTSAQGPEGMRRIILACASAGVCVVLVPGIDGCHASSASRWLSPGGGRAGGGCGGRAMIALSLRYRRDDQLYFSLFREAGAILAAHAGRKQFSPDTFAREFLIPPEEDEALAEAAAESRESGRGSGMGKAIVGLARRLRIAPGLVVGRLQHDGLITWKEHNDLKRQVDLKWVLESAAALEETWPDQGSAVECVSKDLSVEPKSARDRVRYAIARGQLLTNGQTWQRMRLEPGRLAAWRLAMRDRGLDAEEREEAA